MLIGRILGGKEKPSWALYYLPAHILRQTLHQLVINKH